LKANEITDDKKAMARFKILMGAEAYDICALKMKPDGSTKKDANNADVPDENTLDEMKAFMTAHFVPEVCEFSEIIIFRRARRQKDETVNDYSMRLRNMAKYCNFGSNLDREILIQLVHTCGMEEFERKCCRTKDLTLSQALMLATGYERINSNVKALHQPTERELAYTGHGYVNYTARGSNDTPDRSGMPHTSGYKNNNDRSCYNCGGKPHQDK